jgi:hyperosmotically inducible periplasmic protein
MYHYFFLRKADEMGLNFWLRFLAFGLIASLFLQAFYYFASINSATPLRGQETISGRAAEEQEKNDAALTSTIRAAMARTKRLYSLQLGVKNRAGRVTLTGEVPSMIDRELAANLAREIPGVQAVNNEILVLAKPSRLGEDGAKINSMVNVEDLEMAANLREMIQALDELKVQPIQIKVQQRVVTLTGQVATTQQRQRAEQVVRYAPKVTSVNNHLRLDN